MGVGLIKSWTDKKGINFTEDGVLQFAPTVAIENYIRPRARQCLSVDIYCDTVDKKKKIEVLALPSNAFDYIICFHVLERANDDLVALTEIN